MSENVLSSVQESRQGTRPGEIGRLCASVARPCVVQELSHVATHYRHFVEAASLIALVTSGDTEPECTVWGDTNCRVVCQDERVLVSSDVCGEQGTRWLGNVARDDRVRLLFVVAGASCVLRVSGRARTEQRTPPPTALGRAAAEDLPCLVVTIAEAAFRRMTGARRRQRAAAKAVYPEGGA